MHARLRACRGRAGGRAGRMLLCGLGACVNAWAGKWRAACTSPAPVDHYITTPLQELTLRQVSSASQMRRRQ
eukprot:359071-Chlamydomonas_euryale.AAC.5